MEYDSHKDEGCEVCGGPTPDLDRVCPSCEDLAQAAQNLDHPPGGGFAPEMDPTGEDLQTIAAGIEYQPGLSSTPPEERSMDPEDLACEECGRYAGAANDKCVYCR